MSETSPTYATRLTIQPPTVQQKPASMLLSIPVAALIAVIAGILSYVGAAQRPALVPDPITASLTTGVCFFFLLFPFTRIRRDVWGILSPEAMGGVGYLVYIGIAAVTNHMWPGLAVNPSLFGYLPAGIIGQTAAALAFFVGTQVARQWGTQSVNRKTQPNRLAVVILLYAGFAFYLSILMPRTDPTELAVLVRAGDSVSWTLTVGPFIVLQSLPMLVAAQTYLTGPRFVLIRHAILAILGFSVVLFLVSGSRTYAAQVIILLLASRALASRRFEKAVTGSAIGAAVGMLILVTIFRLSGSGPVTISPSTLEFADVVQRVRSVEPAATAVGAEGIVRNLQENIVYHLSDNQTMAMLIRNYNRGPLFGLASYNSLLSALPSSLRPNAYRSGTNEVINHFRFYKEYTADADYLPDWQISVGALGFADFWLFGLLIFPFALGLALRWLFNKIVLTNGLGEAGWLLYVPLVQMLWNPLLFGPDSPQVLRLLIPLAIALRWTAVNESGDKNLIRRRSGSSSA